MVINVHSDELFEFQMHIRSIRNGDDEYFWSSQSHKYLWLVEAHTSIKLDERLSDLILMLKMLS